MVLIVKHEHVVSCLLATFSLSLLGHYKDGDLRYERPYFPCVSAYRPWLGLDRRQLYCTSQRQK
jgi:hypothetical protein